MPDELSTQVGEVADRAGPRVAGVDQAYRCSLEPAACRVRKCFQPADMAEICEHGEHPGLQGERVTAGGAGRQRVDDIGDGLGRQRVEPAAEGEAINATAGDAACAGAFVRPQRHPCPVDRRRQERHRVQHLRQAVRGEPGTEMLIRVIGSVLGQAAQESGERGRRQRWALE